MDDGRELQALVHAAAAGDPGAQTKLVERSRRRARERAERLVEASAVDDVVQEALVEVLATLSRLRNPEALPAWVGLAVRKHADRHRRRRRPAEAIGEDHAAESGGDPAERSELINRVRAALAVASDADRRLLELHYLADWPIADLADLLGLSQGAVRKRLHDARRRLRPSLQDLHDPRRSPMTNLEHHLGAVHQPGTLDLPEPPPIARPAAYEALATGLTVLDVLAPVARGGTVELVGPAGTGHLILVLELAERMNRNDCDPAIVAAASTRQSLGAWSNLGKLVTELDDPSRHAVVLGDHPEAATQTVRDAARLAQGLAGRGTDVLLVVDKATADAAAGGPLGLRDLAGLSAGGGSVTLLLVDPYAADAALPPDAGMDTRLVFSAEQLALRIFPALDPVLSKARFHRSDVADEVRAALAVADHVRHFFGQSMVVAQGYTGEEPSWIERTEAENELRTLLATE